MRAREDDENGCATDSVDTSRYFEWSGEWNVPLNADESVSALENLRWGNRV